MALQNALGTDMATLARRLQEMGRGKDRVLAHITHEEAALLKARGGRGSINPATGLLEFDDAGIGTEYSVQSANAIAPPVIEAPIPIPQQQAQQPAPAQPTEAVTVTGQKQQPQNVTISNVPTDFGPVNPPAPVLPAQPVAAPAAPAAPAAAPAAPVEAVGVTGTRPAAPAIDYSYLDKPYQPPAEAAPAKSTNDQAKGFLSNNSTLLEILGLGGLGLFGARNAAQSGQQAAALQSNLAGLAQPALDAGNTAMSTTLAGGLTPQNQQALDAARAQTAQGQSGGAVSSQQATEAISTTFANLLNTQLNQALTLLNQADTQLQNAYTQGYNANVANQTNTQNFYSSLAQLAARIGGVGGSGTTITLPAGSSVQ